MLDNLICDEFKCTVVVIQDNTSFFDIIIERLYMETQDGLKTTALTLFLNLFFHFLTAAALCDDFSLVDSVET